MSYHNRYHQLQRKLVRRKLIAHAMPATKAEARKACDEAVKQWQIKRSANAGVDSSSTPHLK